MFPPPFVAPDTFQFFVVTQANPFALEWVPLQNFGVGGDEFQSGASSGFVWHNFTVNVLGEFYFVDPADPTPEELAELQQQSLNSRNFTSLLKLEVEYPQGESRIRRFRMDIGAGIDIFIPPTYKVACRVLGPDPDSIPPNLPDGFETGIQLATTLVVTSQCVAAPLDRPLATYTQLVSSGPAPSVFVPRVAGSVDVQVLSPVTALDDRVREVLVRTVTGSSPDITLIGDVEPIFTGAKQTHVTRLSAPTTDIVISGVGVPAFEAVSVIQGLEF